MEVLSEEGLEGMGKALELLLNEAMRAERAAFLGAVPNERTTERVGRKQYFCWDRGYDCAVVRAPVERFGYTLHIKSRGEEMHERRSNPRYRTGPWAVERSHSWMNHFRRLLIRWEKKATNYEAFLHLACAWITFRRVGVCG